MSDIKLESNERNDAEVFSMFIDRLNDDGPQSIDLFLEEFPDHEESLRPLMEITYSLKSDFSINEITQEVIERRFDIFKQGVKSLEQSEKQLTLDKRPDFLLLLIGMMNGVSGTTRLTKLLFLMWKEARFDKYVPDFYAHSAYNFGPFDETIFKDLEALKKHGLISEGHTAINGSMAKLNRSGDAYPQKVLRTYGLTDRGHGFTNNLLKTTEKQHPEIIEAIGKIIEIYGHMKLKDLLKYVYSKYPEYADKSKIRKEILGDDLEGGEDEEGN